MGKANFYDISGKIDNSKAEVKIDETHIFKIHRSMAIGLKINDIYANEELKWKEKLKQIITITMGQEAYEYIESLDLIQGSYEEILNAIMAALGNTTIEIVKEQAEAAKEENKKK
ncbi:MAG: hypothetical protein K0S61_4003 [Anaerocolumna sp.]|jgi:hypothetical protein|nr:hypothetical protein [Anaerocolumna sp.]